MKQKDGGSVVPDIMVQLIRRYLVFESVIQYLIDCGADVMLECPDGDTILNKAIKSEHRGLDSVRIILKEIERRLGREGATEYVDAFDGKGFNALYYGCCSRKGDVVRLLVHEYSANLSWRYCIEPGHRVSAIQIASKQNRNDIASYLRSKMYRKPLF